MLLDRIDILAERALVDAEAQGVAIGISTREGERLIRTYGFANRDAALPVGEETLFEIGSISKSFLAIVCMQLAAEGKLDLHAPVTDYLPWFEVRSEFAPITTHHLLCHTSGLPGGHTHRPHALHEVWELRNVRTIAPPGVVWEYSNVGYDALGLMVEAITGQSFDQFMRERVLEPLGLFNSYAVVTSAIRPRLAVGYNPRFDDRPSLPRHGVVPATWLETAVGSGSIVMNASDLLTYAEFLLRTWNGEDTPVLTSAQLHVMVDPASLPESAQQETYGYGIEWQVDPEQPEAATAIGHSGGMVGYTADLLVDVEHGCCVVWLANGMIGDRELIGSVRETLAAAVDSLPELPPVSDRFVFTDGAEYAGAWHGQHRAFEIVSDGTNLILHSDDGNISLQRQPGRETFLLVDHPEWELFPLEVVRDATGDAADDPGPVVILHHGSETFSREGAGMPEWPTYPTEWDRYVGFYRSYNPWGSPIRIVVREGRLTLLYASGWAAPLTPEGDGFRVGEAPQNLDYLVFDGIAGDRAFIIRFETGAEFSRFFTD